MTLNDAEPASGLDDLVQMPQVIDVASLVEVVIRLRDKRQVAGILIQSRAVQRNKVRLDLRRIGTSFLHVVDLFLLDFAGMNDTVLADEFRHLPGPPAVSGPDIHDHITGPEVQLLEHVFALAAVLISTGSGQIMLLGIENPRAFARIGVSNGRDGDYGEQREQTRELTHITTPYAFIRTVSSPLSNAAEHRQR